MKTIELTKSEEFCLREALIHLIGKDFKNHGDLNTKEKHKINAEAIIEKLNQAK